MDVILHPDEGQHESEMKDVVKIQNIMQNTNFVQHREGKKKGELEIKHVKNSECQANMNIILQKRRKRNGAKKIPNKR